MLIFFKSTFSVRPAQDTKTNKDNKEAY